jgi:uncharacterized protein YbjQ (UPF0145 family)
MGGEVIVIAIVAYGMYLYFKNKRAKKAYLKKVAFIENEVRELKKEIMCVTSSMVHGKEVLKTFGSVKGTSKSTISSDYPTRFADNEAMYEMLIEAKILGANAIVDLNMNTPTYEISGSKWQTSQIIYTGTAIKIV